MKKFFFLWHSWYSWHSQHQHHMWLCMSKGIIHCNSHFFTFLHPQKAQAMAVAMVPLEKECAVPLWRYILVHVCHQQNIVQRKTRLIVDSHCWVRISVHHTWLCLCIKSYDVWSRRLLVETTVSSFFRFLPPSQCHSSIREAAVPIAIVTVDIAWPHLCCMQWMTAFNSSQWWKVTASPGQTRACMTVVTSPQGRQRIVLHKTKVIWIFTRYQFF